MENEKIKRPAIVEDKHLKYLDRLRESGKTNMYGAGVWLQNAFPLSREESSTILLYWMKTFTERHQEDNNAK